MWHSRGIYDEGVCTETERKGIERKRRGPVDRVQAAAAEKDEGKKKARERGLR